LEQSKIIKAKQCKIITYWLGSWQVAFQLGHMHHVVNLAGSWKIKLVSDCSDPSQDKVWSEEHERQFLTAARC
jgi:hypothetical protein